MKKRKIISACVLISVHELFLANVSLADTFTFMQGTSQTITQSIATAPYTISATATGGAGGTPGAIVGVGDTYIFGDGGLATARAFAAGTTGAQASSTATAGSGGGIANVNGDQIIYAGNGAIATAVSSANASSGSVLSSATQIAGSGGSVEFQQNDSAQGYAGNGADSTMINAATGFCTNGALTLTQSSTAGNGGNVLECWGGGSTGIAGSGTATITLATLDTETSVNATNHAFGGNGGSSGQVSGIQILGKPGGAATASTVLTAESLTVLSPSALSTGGNGGSANEGGSPAIGGIANSTVSGLTTGSGSVTSYGVANGGRGGSLIFSQANFPSPGLGGSGAEGGAASSQSTATTNSETASASSIATGGAGGDGDTRGFAGGTAIRVVQQQAPPASTETRSQRLPPPAVRVEEEATARMAALVEMESRPQRRYLSMAPPLQRQRRRAGLVVPLHQILAALISGSPGHTGAASRPFSYMRVHSTIFNLWAPAAGSRRRSLRL